LKQPGNSSNLSREPGQRILLLKFMVTRQEPGDLNMLMILLKETHLHGDTRVKTLLMMSCIANCRRMTGRQGEGER
jgi:hypothetical protein